MGEVSHLREALRLCQTENAHFAAEKIQEKLNSLPKLTFYKKIVSNSSEVELKELTKKAADLKLVSHSRIFAVYL